MKSPLVSIVIPTFNRADMLKKAIESALLQDYENIEIIVSDNASTDHTPDIISAFTDISKIRIFRNEQNIGMVANWRKALLEHVKGDWFLMLSDDDVLTDPSYIREAARMIEEHPELVMIYAGGRVVDAEGVEIGKLELPFPRVASGRDVFLSRGLIKPQDFTLCNVLFSTEVSKSVCAFSNDWNISCDSELFLKLCVIGDVGVVHRLVSDYTIHSNNLLPSVGKSADLFIGLSDSFVNPYVLAKESDHFNERELKEWVDRLLVPNLRATLLRSRFLLPHRHAKIRDSLIQRCGSLVNVAESQMTLSRQWRWWKKAKLAAIRRFVGLD